MRFSSFIGFSNLGIFFFSGLLFISCGSFQSGSYYTDGIYNSDNVIVVRRNKKTQATNAYTQYFDQQANQYNWDCLLYTSPSPRDGLLSRMPSSA